jgi:hypothetical protein
MAQETRYHCPSCGTSLGVLVQLTTPPVHKCVKKANRLVPLVPVDAKSPDNQSDD